MSNHIETQSASIQASSKWLQCPSKEPFNDGTAFFPASLKSAEWRGVRKAFSAKEHLYREGDQADQAFLIEWGAAFTYSITASGERRIVGIYTGGDLFGVLADKHHRLSCQCASPVDVYVFSRKDFLSHARSDVSTAVWLSALKEQSRTENHILQLGASAVQRVAGFILDRMDENCETRPVKLYMDRRVIADYLCLTIETVSRVFTELKEIGAIKIEHVNTIHVNSRKRLTKICNGNL